MTAIVGLVDKGTVYIGGDSASVEPEIMMVHSVKGEKVFINGSFVYGFCKSFRAGQVLRYSFVPPKHPPKMDTVKYLSTLFTDKLRKTYEKSGYGGNDDEGDIGGCFILGYDGRLFIMYEDYNISEPADGFAAVGCADMACLGSLYSTKDKHPLIRIHTALTAAEHFSGGVRGPWTIKSIKGKK